MTLLLQLFVFQMVDDLMYYVVEVANSRRCVSSKTFLHIFNGVPEDNLMLSRVVDPVVRGAVAGDGPGGRAVPHGGRDVQGSVYGHGYAHVHLHDAV